MPEKDVTLEAQWVKTEGMWHSVTYVDGVDGEEIGVPAGSASVLQGTEYTVSAEEPERTGWTFTGWKTSDVTGSEQTYQAEGTFTMPEKDVTLEAQWEADKDTKYTVEFYFQDDETGKFEIDDSLTDETRIGTTDQPVSVTDADKAVERDNYVFDEENASNVLADATLNGDGSTTLKVYYKLSLDVEYDLAGGKVGEGVETSYAGLDWGTDTPTISGPTRDGYTFAGWEPEVAEKVTADATYTAQWTANFHADDLNFTVSGATWIYNGNTDVIDVTGILVGDQVTYTWQTESRATQKITCNVVDDGQGNPVIQYEPTFKNVSDSATVLVNLTRSGVDSEQLPATMTVNPASITVTADNQTKVAGTADPTLTSKHSPAVGNEIPGWSGRITRDSGEAVGSYAITQGNLALADGSSGFLAENYTLTFVPGTLTITPAPVTPGGGGDTPTPAPVPDPVPADDATDDDAETEEAIDDDTTPLVSPTETIDDGDTPLAAGKHEDCWVHWIILIGMILSSVYFVGVSVRRRKFTSSLLGYEDKVLDNDRDNA